MYNARISWDASKDLEAHPYGRTLYEMHPPVYVFHDIGPKRWNVLLHLLDMLFERYGSVRMLEIGVDL